MNKSKTRKQNNKKQQIAPIAFGVDTGSHSPATINSNVNNSSLLDQGLQKFEEIRIQNEEKAKAIASSKDYESSSEEEDLNETDILNGIFRNYSGDKQQLAKTQTFLENFFQSGSAICLICIGTVKRPDSIWSCQNCYCFFHFQCLRRWSNDSIALQKLNSEQQIQSYYNNQGEFIAKKKKPLRWCCPKCRKDYPPEDIPKIYECFCGKESNPINHPWLIPHSCGEICEKYLQPECGHKCLLLCHPGPCPPCPQHITISCKCQKSSFKTVRCFQKTWECEMKCDNVLVCGIHKCGKICHEVNKCPPCTKRSIQKCVCGNEKAEKNCSQSIWHCNKVCNKRLKCGLHVCKKVCHTGDCGECPMGLPRACPCGKNKTIAPCSEPIETCGDTCQKVLACGIHYCTQRCHKGDCSLCLEITEKSCRCGLHKKEQPCSKIFTCEMKCKLMKDCRKHACSKKCCDGQCLPCDKICNKTLSCKKHKCKSICHDGQCYPCDLKSTVKCRCGQTFITVPCGREKKTKIPKCMQPCKIASKCHHNNPHKCHMNDCPSCIQKCGLPNDTTKCLHPCEGKCHAAIKTEIKNNISTNIWDWKEQTFEFKKLPHPKCEIAVTVTCIGGHETTKWPCWNSQPSSCQRMCARKLKCGNHNCDRICHAIPDLNNPNAQEGCTVCDQMCQIQRPNGCIHPCQKRCHLPPCDICTIIMKTNCSCGLTQVYFKCNEFYMTTNDDDEIFMNQQKREELKSCGNRCIKNYPCGHRCTAICHSGECPNPENCRKKVKIFCNCKNLKVDISCDKYRAGNTKLSCDTVCAMKTENEKRLKDELEHKQQLIEMEKNRIELEQFEKKFGKKKPKERKNYVIEQTNNNHMKILISIGVFFSITSITLIIMFMNF